MSWMWDLIVDKQPDFWLNIFAGIPFLIFDVIIITVLLPSTIQWWDERRWRETRLTAMAHVLSRYNDVSSDLSKLGGLQALGTEFLPFNFSQSDVMKPLAAHAEAMDLELQTALPIMGPEMSQDVLALHYKWKTFLRSFATEIQMNAYNKNERMAVEISARRLCEESADLNLAWHQLRVKYAPTEWQLDQARSGIMMPFDFFARIYQPVATALYRSPETGSSLSFASIAWDTQVRQRYELAKMQKIRPVCRRNFISWVTFKQRVDPYDRDPDDRARDRKEYFDRLQARMNEFHTIKVTDRERGSEISPT